MLLKAVTQALRRHLARRALWKLLDQYEYGAFRLLLDIERDRLVRGYYVAEPNLRCPACSVAGISDEKQARWRSDELHRIAGDMITEWDGGFLTAHDLALWTHEWVRVRHRAEITITDSDF